ncbi:Ca2+-binding RTX toxin-like protein [Sphingomonas zeicaulis]|uniref:calcium-binding protein n=1 Tax=Sphingomonas zeicaulis TaxID=1632740 RepID=UPI003D1A7399
MAEFVIDRSSGTLIFSTGYNTTEHYLQVDDHVFVKVYESSWGFGFDEIGGSDSIYVSNYSSDAYTSVVVGAPLGPTPVMRQYYLSFETQPLYGDSYTDGNIAYIVQSAAYFTTAVTLNGQVFGEEPYIVINDVLIGGSAADTLSGMIGDDWLDGGEGADLLLGGEGNDAGIGGAGADTIEGGVGNDRLDGGAGADILRGGIGDDTYIFDGLDTIVERAGEGNDTLAVSANQFTLTIANIENLSRIGGGSFRGTGNAGANQLNGGSGADYLDGAAGNDVLNGGDGNDTLTGGTGADSLNGGAGIDTVSYEAATGGVGLNLLTGVVSGAAAGDSFSGIEIVKGTAFNDLLRGDAAANTLYGNDGVDDVRGGDGNDVLYGGAGDDRLLGEAGNDRLSGGAGNDIFYLNPGNGRDTVMDFTTGDVLRIGHGLPFDSIADILAVSTQSGANTVIRFDASNSVTLLNVSLATLDAGDFLFA